MHELHCYSYIYVYLLGVQIISLVKIKPNSKMVYSRFDNVNNLTRTVSKTRFSRITISLYNNEDGERNPNIPKSNQETWACVWCVWVPVINHYFLHEIRGGGYDHIKHWWCPLNHVNNYWGKQPDASSKPANPPRTRLNWFGFQFSPSVSGAFTIPTHGIKWRRPQCVELDTSPTWRKVMNSYIEIITDPNIVFYDDLKDCW